MKKLALALSALLAPAVPAQVVPPIDSVPIVALADTANPDRGPALLDSLQHDTAARRALFDALRGRYKHNDYIWRAIPESSLGPALLAIVHDPAASPHNAWDALQFYHVWEARGDRQRIRALRARATPDTALANDMDMADDQWLGQQLGNAVPRFLQTVKPFTVTKKDAIRVLVFGDYGNLPAQKAIAADMRRYHRDHPFDLGVTVGDNFYNPDGMSSPTGPRWRTLWENVYGPMHIPIYASLGNHDWYVGDAPAAEILHTGKSPTWNMPGEFYRFRAGPVEFFAVNTGIAEVSPVQLQWLAHALATSTARWKVAYGHYPVVNPDGSPEPHMAELLAVLEQGHADAYLCGHIHDLSKIPPRGNLHFLLSGGGGTEGKGFAVLRADQHRITMTLVGQGLTERGTETLTK